MILGTPHNPLCPFLATSYWPGRCSRCHTKWLLPSYYTNVITYSKVHFTIMMYSHAIHIGRVIVSNSCLRALAQKDKTDNYPEFQQNIIILLWSFYFLKASSLPLPDRDVFCLVDASEFYLYQIPLISANVYPWCRHSNWKNVEAYVMDGRVTWWNQQRFLGNWITCLLSV